MIITHSLFYYGFTVQAGNSANNKIDFREGTGSALTASVPVGSYSVAGYCQAVAQAMNAIGNQLYTVTFDRTTRFITIAGTSINFNLLALTGVNSGFGAWTMLGVSKSADHYGLSYTGTCPAGLAYRTQYMLQSFVSGDDYQDAVDPSMNETTAGDVELIKYGDRKYVSFDIQFATSRTVGGGVIRNNATGIEDLRSLMSFLASKSRVEFMPDESNPSSFVTLILESTADNAKGTGFKLKEMYDVNLPGFYKTGDLKFRIVGS